MHFHREKPARPAPRGPKPTLKMTQLPIFRVHYRALEDYFCRVFGWGEFDLLASEGCTPGLVPEYTVTSNLPPASDASRRAQGIRGGRRTRNVSLILTVLCQDGYIPAGRYIVDTRAETPPLETYRELLQRTSTPESKECRAFRASHRHDQNFTRVAAEMDSQVMQALRELKQ